jgi:thiol-disulfide isomerase/thioredoxin
MPLPAFCKFICPAGTLEGGLILLANAANNSYLSLLGGLFTWKVLLTVSIVLGCLFVFRLFCRFICPLGAVYGLFNKLSFFGIKVDTHKCIDCDRCAAKCLLDVKRPGDMECISCGECIDVCPTQAILWKGPKLTKKPQTGKTKAITRGISAVLMAAVLLGTIGCSWKTSGAESALGSISCDLSVIDSTGISQNTVNPAETGKLTIVNFWGVWCAPCIEELPYFDRIASEYPEEVAVIAVHTDMASETAPEFIQKYYPDTQIVFAKDIDAEGYYAALGGRDAYPYTVVLDKNGSVISTFVGPVSYSDLQKIVETNKK